MIADATEAGTSLLLYLYQSPLRIAIVDDAGTVELMTPVAAQMLMPLSANARLDNLWDLLDPFVPSLRRLRSDCQNDKVCDNLEFTVPWQTTTRTFSLSLNRIGPNKLMGSITDVSEQIRRRDEKIKAIDIALEQQKAQNQRTHKDMREVLDGLPSFVSSWDVNLCNRFANAAYVKQLGINTQSIEGRRLPDLLTSNWLDQDQPHWSVVLTGKDQTYERVIWNPRTEEHQYFLVHLIADFEDGDVRGFYELAHDITTSRKLQLALTDREALLNTAGRLANVGGWSIDIESGAVYWSRQIFSMAGLPKDHSPTLESMLERFAPKDRQALQAAMDHALQSGEGWSLELPMNTLDGRLIWVHLIGEVEIEDGKLVRIVGATQDITARRATEEHIHILANQDEVTGLSNRAQLLRTLDSTLQDLNAHNGSCILMSVHVDAIRKLTEVMGFGPGDSLAMAVASRLQALTSPGDMVARVSNEEFAVVLSANSVFEDPVGSHRASAILESLATPERVGAVEVVPIARLGIARYPGDADTSGGLLQAAQTARMSLASEARPVANFSDRLRADAMNVLAIESALRSAVEQNELSLSFQLQADLKSGAADGAEVFLEWQHPQFGRIDPSVFMPIAERTGLVVMLGQWQQQAALQLLQQWNQQGHAPIRLALNVSSLELQQPDFVATLRAQMQRYGVNPDWLGLEVSEQALVKDPRALIPILSQLRALGIAIVLDDFGAGYSNISMLRQFPVDVVKVHRSCIPDVTAPTDEVSLTRTIISLAHSLRIRVAADGVESEGQMILLVANGCDQLQGRVLANPMDAATLLDSLGKTRLPANVVKRDQVRTLLLVDDEPNIVSSLKRLFRKEGYRVVTASGGAEGLQRMAEYAVDVVISDQRMPGMTGVEFLRRAKELYPDTVRLVLSGYTELQSITDAINEGAIYRFLTKPWDDTRLLVHVQEAFRHKGMADENKRLSHEVVTANDQLALVNERLNRVLDTQKTELDREKSRADVSRDIVDFLPVAALGVDPQGTVVLMNREAQRILSSQGPVLGESVSSVLRITPNDLGRHPGHAHDWPQVQIAGRPYRLRVGALGHTEDRGELIVLEAV